MDEQPLARVAILDDAIAANAELLSRQDPAFIADVSFDAYGHGALRAALAALEGGASAIAVASSAEAERLRSSGLAAPVVIGARVPPLDLYGLGTDTAFAPAMSVSSLVVGVKSVEEGEGVSYGYTYRATRHTNLAMVGIGYADGLDRSASNSATVLLDGALRPIAGRVAMNVLMADLGEDSASIGTEVSIIGPDRRAADWASLVGRSAVEVVLEFAQQLGGRRP